MRTLLTRRAGQRGTKKLTEKWGADLVCVRYRYDDARMERLTTVEIVVERVAWRERKRDGDGSAPVRMRIDKHEDLLRRAVLFAGGKWDERTDTWTLPRAAAIALGLSARLLRRRHAEGSPVDQKGCITGDAITQSVYTVIYR